MVKVCARYIKIGLAKRSRQTDTPYSRLPEWSRIPLSFGLNIPYPVYQYPSNSLHKYLSCPITFYPRYPASRKPLIGPWNLYTYIFHRESRVDLLVTFPHVTVYVPSKRCHANNIWLRAKWSFHVTLSLFSGNFPQQFWPSLSFKRSVLVLYQRPWKRKKTKAEANFFLFYLFVCC